LVPAGLISAVSAQLSWRYIGFGEGNCPGNRAGGSGRSGRLSAAGKKRIWWLPRIEGLGRRSLRATVDVRDRSSIELLQRKVLDSFLKVDILVNAAGITHKIPTLECSEEEWTSILDINLNGTCARGQIFGKAMMGQALARS